MSARGAIVILHESTAQNRTDAEHFEVIAADQFAAEPVRGIAVSHACGKAVIPNDAAEHVVLIAKIAVHRVREGVVALYPSLVWTGGVEHDDLLRRANR